MKRYGQVGEIICNGYKDSLSPPCGCARRSSRAHEGVDRMAALRGTRSSRTRREQSEEPTALRSRNSAREKTGQ